MNHKYRKKPVVIEAFQWKCASEQFPETWPVWLREAWELPKGTRNLFAIDDGEASIYTLEGIHAVSKNDWIIRGVKGELYSCKPDIFVMTYEKVPT